MNEIKKQLKELYEVLNKSWVEEAPTALDLEGTALVNFYRKGADTIRIITYSTGIINIKYNGVPVEDLAELITTITKDKGLLTELYELLYKLEWAETSPTVKTKGSPKTVYKKGNNVVSIYQLEIGVQVFYNGERIKGLDGLQQLIKKLKKRLPKLLDLYVIRKSNTGDNLALFHYLGIEYPEHYETKALVATLASTSDNPIVADVIKIPKTLSLGLGTVVITDKPYVYFSELVAYVQYSSMLKDMFLEARENLDNVKGANTFK